MEFELFGDGKWRCTTNQGLFTSSFEPDEKTEWEEADVLTGDGRPVFVPKTQKKTIAVDKLKVHKKSERTESEVEIEFV